MQANGTLGTTAVWLAFSALPETVTGLSPLTAYCFQVKARNEDQVETALSTQACVTTAAQTGGISAVAANTVTAFCNGAAYTQTINYTSTLSAGSYTAQLSNAMGSFGGIQVVGSGTSATAIAISIPAGTAAGTGYRIRIINGNVVSDTTAAFTIKAAPAGSLVTSTPVNCPGAEATAKLTFNATAASEGPYGLSIKNTAANTTLTYSGIVSATPFDVDSTQLPAAGNTDYELLEITSANGCSNP